MTKIKKFQFKGDKKQEILEFEKENTIKKTESKLIVTRISIYCWKKQINNK